MVNNCPIVTIDGDEHTIRDSHGRPHCNDGPAISIAGVMEEWHHHGIPHRVDGPAIIGTHTYAWYVKGTRIDSWEQLKYEANLSDVDLLLMVLKWGEMPPKPFQIRGHTNGI